MLISSPQSLVPVHIYIHTAPVVNHLLAGLLDKYYDVSHDIYLLTTIVLTLGLIRLLNSWGFRAVIIIITLTCWRNSSSKTIAWTKSFSHWLPCNENPFLSQNQIILLMVVMHIMYGTVCKVHEHKNCNVLYKQMELLLVVLSCLLVLYIVKTRACLTVLPPFSFYFLLTHTMTQVTACASMVFYWSPCSCLLLALPSINLHKASQ